MASNFVGILTAVFFVGCQISGSRSYSTSTAETTVTTMTTTPRSAQCNTTWIDQCVDDARSNVFDACDAIVGANCTTVLGRCSNNTHCLYNDNSLITVQSVYSAQQHALAYVCSAQPLTVLQQNAVCPLNSTASNSKCELGNVTTAADACRDMNAFLNCTYLETKDVFNSAAVAVLTMYWTKVFAYNTACTLDTSFIPTAAADITLAPLGSGLSQTVNGTEYNVTWQVTITTTAQSHSPGVSSVVQSLAAAVLSGAILLQLTVRAN